MALLDAIAVVLEKYALITAFAVIGLVIWLSYLVSARCTGGRLHGSAIAIFAGLLLAWAYSAPPLRLMSRGLGELTVALVWFLVVIGADLVQRQQGRPALGDW